MPRSSAPLTTPEGLPLAVLRDQLAQAIKDTIGTMLQLDFRTPFMGADPNALLRLHEGDLLFAECRDQPRVLHILTSGTAERINDRYSVTGNGGLFAHANF